MQPQRSGGKNTCHGYPAVMITDGSAWSDPQYHDAGDTPEGLDYEFVDQLARGVVGHPDIR